MTDNGSRKRSFMRPFEIDPASNPRLETVQPEPATEANGQTGRETGRELVATPPPEPESRRRGSWAWTALGVSILGLAGLQAHFYVADLMATRPFLGSAFALFLILFLAAAGSFVWREWADLRLIRKRDGLRDDAARLAHSDLHGEAPPLLARLNGYLQPSEAARQPVAIFNQRQGDHLSDGEQLALYERTVLAPLDKRANRLVMESSRDIGLLTALSPLGLLDGILVLWRTTIMLKQVARLYGLTLGPIATFRLLRKCLRNAAIAGVADMVSHAAFEHVGASITAMLSARAGQGAGNALLSARLGLEAIRLARPLPYITLAPPRLKQVREAIFADQETKTGPR